MSIGTDVQTVGALDASRLDSLRWWVGWRPLVTVGGANFAGIALGNAVAVPADVLFGNGLLVMAGLAALGFVVGVVGWFGGTRAVNREYPAILEAFAAETRADAAVALDGEDAGTDDDPRIETLVGGTGSRPLVEASEQYAVTHLFVGEERIRASQARLDLVGREVLFDHRVTEIPFERVRDASWDGSHLTISVADGTTDRSTIDQSTIDRTTTHRFRSDDRPAEALALLDGGIPDGRR